ncbi:MAG: hypothetical protein GYA18_10575 [Chloroflexi bacterium]|nr:hypothetical protein [Chloroflexota bacterium]
MKKYLSFQILLMLSLLMTACNGITISFNDKTTPSDGTDQDAAYLQVGDSETSGTTSHSFPKLILVDTRDDYGLTFYNLQGQPITELKTPGIGYGSSGRVHIAGSIPEGPIMTPLVYHSFTNPESLLVNINDSITTLVQTPTLYGLAGAPGQAHIAYSLYTPSHNTVHSDLFLGDLETLPNIGPVYSLDNSDDFYVINPVAVSTQAAVATGVWYTFSAWGIGGDIIFPVNQGLYYFDMTNGNNYQILDKNCKFQGLSQDFSFAACQHYDSNGNYSYSVENLSASTSTTFALDPSSDRGAGYGVFSQDGNYVAWMEASGSHMAEVPNYHSHIRIAFTGGGIVYDQTDQAIASALGVSALPSMLPVGWLDNQTLLIQVSIDDFGSSALATIDVTDGAVQKIIDGSFVTFAYP